MENNASDSDNIVALTASIQKVVTHLETKKVQKPKQTFVKSKSLTGKKNFQMHPISPWKFKRTEGGKDNLTQMKRDGKQYNW